MNLPAEWQKLRADMYFIAMLFFLHLENNLMALFASAMFVFRMWRAAKLTEADADKQEDRRGP